MNKNLSELNKQLQEKVLNLVPKPGSFATDIKGLRIFRRNQPEEARKCFYKPIIALMLQGSKQCVFNAEKIEYVANECLVTSIDIPSASRITDASPEKPCIGVTLGIDSFIIKQLIIETNLLKTDYPAQRAVGVTKANSEILDAFLRIVTLLEQPKEQQNILAPMIIREIYYRLLMTPVGEQLRMVNTVGTKSNQIATAIEWLKENFKEELNVEKLAAKVNMSPSSFYRNFRKVTDVSPLQYQKQLRLYEAQRLMVSDNLDAANAGYAVGYESPTQFNREYKRMFGNPPKTDIKILQTL
ncbi:AraC-type DNA-binding domain-containing protein [Elusimicrobium minutum Pei191]|uniref:AraC-type DNA-binding domain-containing protein n=1 Tax=Elusimicrobium minutum (strain Pei191) TaxID=445932 RepID=B2KD36_ELUMP|nr:AraC family transcriptional regulator [Elusimicrobium minutum]ACC98432.1 AraC-type DNA-binding domain-containing protein [Elusimicrobium minutum Pei191]